MGRRAAAKGPAAGRPTVKDWYWEEYILIAAVLCGFFAEVLGFNRRRQ
jgi:hypothetical protein